MPRAWLAPHTIETGTVQVTLTVPVDLYLAAAFRGAILALAMAENWEQTGTATPEDCAAAFARTLDEAIEKMM